MLHPEQLVKDAWVSEAEKENKKMGSNVLEQITVPKLNHDGTFGEVTWNVFTMDSLLSSRYKTVTINTDNIWTGTIEISQPNQSRDIKPFKCPCCNGNSYKEVGNKIICEYCGTEFMEK